MEQDQATLTKPIQLTMTQEDIKAFRRTLPHKYYEENLLHIISIEDIKDYEECMAKLKHYKYKKRPINKTIYEIFKNKHVIFL